jgi:hypothetical protein
MEKQNELYGETTMTREEEEKQDEKTRKVYDALDTYYRLKAKYDESIEKERHRIMKLPELSWKEKRTQYKKYKPKCVNCSRQVGTLFSVKKDKEGDKIALALCGDREKPCPLNININLGDVINLSDDVEMDQKEISEYKKEIIIDKNNLLFGYINSSEAVEKFDRIKESMTQLIRISEHYLQMYMGIVENPSRIEMKQKVQTEVYENIKNMKKMISEFDKTDNLQIINEIVGKYKEELIPRLKELMEYKYAYSNVEYVDDKYHLIQKKYTIENLEYDISKVERRVVMMRMGMKQSKTQSVVKKPKFRKQVEAEFESESESEPESESDSGSESGSDDDDRIKLKISQEETPLKIDMDMDLEQNE